MARVADRLAAGLHGIPEERIRERYERSMERAVEALNFVDHAVLLDNSSASQAFRLVAEFNDGRRVAVIDDIPSWAAAILSRFALRIRTEESSL